MIRIILHVGTCEKKYQPRVRGVQGVKYNCVRRVAWERRDIVVSEGLEFRSKKRPRSEKKLWDEMRYMSEIRDRSESVHIVKKTMNKAKPPKHVSLIQMSMVQAHFHTHTHVFMNICIYIVLQIHGHMKIIRLMEGLVIML